MKIQPSFIYIHPIRSNEAHMFLNFKNFRASEKRLVKKQESNHLFFMKSRFRMEKDCLPNNGYYYLGWVLLNHSCSHQNEKQVMSTYRPLTKYFYQQIHIFSLISPQIKFRCLYFSICLVLPIFVSIEATIIFIYSRLFDRASTFASCTRVS